MEHTQGRVAISNTDRIRMDKIIKMFFRGWSFRGSSANATLFLQFGEAQQDPRVTQARISLLRFTAQMRFARVLRFVPPGSTSEWQAYIWTCRWIRLQFGPLFFWCSEMGTRPRGRQTTICTFCSLFFGGRLWTAQSLTASIEGLIKAGTVYEEWAHMNDYGWKTNTIHAILFHYLRCWLSSPNIVFQMFFLRISWRGGSPSSKIICLLFEVWWTPF